MIMLHALAGFLSGMYISNWLFMWWFGFHTVVKYVADSQFIVIDLFFIWLIVEKYVRWCGICGCVKRAEDPPGGGAGDTEDRAVDSGESLQRWHCEVDWRDCLGQVATTDVSRRRTHEVGHGVYKLVQNSWAGVCLSVCLFVCPFVCLSIRLSVCLCAFSSDWYSWLIIVLEFPEVHSVMPFSVIEAFILMLLWKHIDFFGDIESVVFAVTVIRLEHLFARWHNLWHYSITDKVHNIPLSIKHSETWLSCQEQSFIVVSEYVIHT